MILTNSILLECNMLANTFAGTISSTFGALTSLYYLRLWSNRLSGFIPAELSQRAGSIPEATLVKQFHTKFVIHYVQYIENQRP
jgi:hypothetical protein